jgi:60 kDa SS-A/Ro ribonucleoprotein
MKNYLNAINPFKATQLERVRADQIQNNAGGFVFAVSDEQRFLRFLILGTEGGTYYVGERVQTKLETTFVQKFVAR